jgi:hypothetical protein
MGSGSLSSSTRRSALHSSPASPLTWMERSRAWDCRCRSCRGGGVKRRGVTEVRGLVRSPALWSAVWGMRPLRRSHRLGHRRAGRGPPWSTPVAGHSSRRLRLPVLAAVLRAVPTSPFGHPPAQAAPATAMPAATKSTGRPRPRPLDSGLSSPGGAGDSEQFREGVALGWKRGNATWQREMPGGGPATRGEGVSFCEMGVLLRRRETQARMPAWVARRSPGGWSGRCEQ